MRIYCEVCGLGTTNETPRYVCQHCDRQFSHRNSLKSHISYLHIEMPTDEKRYHCVVCGQQFLYKAYLVAHMRRHTGEKPYTCAECGKKFTIRKSLKIHSRIHTGEKPYACNVCNEEFAYKKTFQRHVRIHPGEKQSACGECQDEPKAVNKRSTTITETSSIPRIESQEASYPCGECPLTSTQDCLLTEHVQIHHSTVEKQSPIMTDRPRGDVNRLLYGCGICCQYFATKDEVVKCFNEHELQTGRN